MAQRQRAAPAVPSAERQPVVEQRRHATGARTTDDRLPERHCDWSVRDVSQVNPAGEGQQSVPALLRRLADPIEQLGEVDVHDISFHMELDDDAEGRPTATVYFQHK